MMEMLLLEPATQFNGVTLILNVDDLSFSQILEASPSFLSMAFEFVREISKFIANFLTHFSNFRDKKFSPSISAESMLSTIPSSSTFSSRSSSLSSQKNCPNEFPSKIQISKIWPVKLVKTSWRKNSVAT